MKYILLVTLLVVSLEGVYAQNPEVTDSPCDSPLIQKVNRDGFESLRWRELPAFLRDVYHCRRTARGKTVLKNLEQQGLTRRYDSTHSMQGFSSTLAYCTTIILVVFYTSRLFAG